MIKKFDKESSLFDIAFWRDVPLLNTRFDHVDLELAEAAFKQCPHSIIFIPTSLVTQHMREAILDQNELFQLCHMLTAQERDEKKLHTLSIDLLNSYTAAVIAKVLEIARLRKLNLSDANFSESVESILIEYAPKLSEKLELMAQAIEVNDYDMYKQRLADSLRYFCSIRF